MNTIGIIESLGSADGDVQGTVPGRIEHQADAAHVCHHVGSAVGKEGIAASLRRSPG